MITVSTTWTNRNPDTIYNRLAAKLGREPTSEEIKADLARITDAVRVSLAEKGSLPHQRRR